MPNTLTTWSGALHKSFRVLPTEQFGNEDLLAFLQSEDGTHKDDVLAKMPYDAARSSGSTTGGPNPKRYRDMKQVIETIGLMWQDNDGCIHFSKFGLALKRFMTVANEKNVKLIARHAALALAVCQLRNPTGAGERYDPSMEVFPFRFIWRAMLRLDYRLSSEELNRAIYQVRNAEMLEEAIERIARCRNGGAVADLGTEVLPGTKKNDRIISMVALASFGWTLIDQKDAEGFYTVKPECIRLLEAAVSLPARHRAFTSVEDYVTAISNSACLPEDYR